MGKRGSTVADESRGMPKTGSKRIMDVDLGDCGGDVCPDEGAECSPNRDLYGLELTLLPPALVLALAEPLLLQVAPPRPRNVIQLPSRIPSWWSAPKRRLRPAVRRPIETGKLPAR
jgi:hypothetical protein